MIREGNPRWYRGDVYWNAVNDPVDYIVFFDRSFWSVPEAWIN